MMGSRGRGFRPEDDSVERTFGWWANDPLRRGSSQSQTRPGSSRHNIPALLDSDDWQNRLSPGRDLLEAATRNRPVHSHGHERWWLVWWALPRHNTVSRMFCGLLVSPYWRLITFHFRGRAAQMHTHLRQARRHGCTLRVGCFSTVLWTL